MCMTNPENPAMSSSEGRVEWKMQESEGKETSALLLIKYAGGGLTWLGAVSLAEIGKVMRKTAKKEDG